MLGNQIGDQPSLAIPSRAGLPGRYWRALPNTPSPDSAITAQSPDLRLILAAGGTVRTDISLRSQAAGKRRPLDGKAPSASGPETALVVIELLWVRPPLRFSALPTPTQGVPPLSRLGPPSRPYIVTDANNDPGVWYSAPWPKRSRQSATGGWNRIPPGTGTTAVAGRQTTGVSQAVSLETRMPGSMVGGRLRHSASAS